MPEIVLRASGPEAALHRKLDLLRADGRQVRDEGSDAPSRNWDQFIEGYLGKAWPTDFPDRLSTPLFQENTIAPRIIRKVALLTDAKPQTEIVARRKGLDATARILQQTILAIWDEQQVLDRLQAKLELSASLFGSLVAGILWDPQADFGRGDIILPFFDARQVWYDPAISEADQLDEGEYVILEELETVRSLKQRYPKHAAQIKPMAEAIEGKRRPIRKFLQFFARFRGQAEERSHVPRASVEHFWYHDDTRVRELPPPLETEALAKGATPDSLVFPTGRHTVRIGTTIVVDEANYFWDGKWPYALLLWQPHPDHPYGRSEVEALLPMAEVFNIIGDSIIRNTLISNVVRVVGDYDALRPQDWDEVENTIGSYVKKNPNRSLEIQAPPPLPAYLFTLMGFLGGELDNISGLTDVAFGRRPGRVESGVAIEQLQQASQAVIRLMGRRLEHFLQRIGQKLISRIFQFYLSDRLLHLVGQSGELEAFEFHRQQLIQEILLGTNGDRQKIHERLRSAFQDFVFRVIPGSSLNISRVQKGLQALALFQAGLISGVEVLRMVEWPNPEETRAKAIEEQQQLGLRQGRMPSFRRMGSPRRAEEGFARAVSPE